MKKRLTLLQYLDSASLVLLIITMCGQLDVRSVGRDTLAEGLGYATKTLKVALCDAVFALVLGWFVLRVIQTQSWKRLWWPPLPCWALIFALLLSTLHSATIVSAVADSVAQNGWGPRAFITKESKEALAEMVQWAGYFLLAPWLFVNLLLDRREGEVISRRKSALVAFLLAVAGVTAGSYLQLAVFDEDAPRGFFSSNNMLGAFLAVAVCFIAVRLLAGFGGLSQRGTSVHHFLFGVIAALPLLFASLLFASPWPVLALGLGSLLGLLVLRAHPARTGAYLVFGALFLWTGWNISLSQPVAAVRASNQKVGSETQAVKKQFVEWQAAAGWNTPRERAFATGVGPGNYQGNIGPLYGGLPNEEKLPPDSNNLYLVQAVSIGMLGLATLLWTVGHFLGLAWKAALARGDWLGSAVVSALLTWIVLNFFHAMIVRGVGLVLAFLLALAVVAYQTRRNPAPETAVL